MSNWIRAGMVVAAAIFGGAAAAVALGVRSWNQETQGLLDRMTSGPAGESTAVRVYDPAVLRCLPEPVARYFEFALRPGQELVRTAVIRHQGEFRSGLDAGWSPFASTQHFSVDPAGFVWDARIRMAPLMAVRVRDHYHAGGAGMLAKLGGVLTVVDQKDEPTLVSGAFHRYMAELAWLPTAMLPGQGLEWEAIDQNSARATLSDSGVTVSMDVHFAPTGEITRVEMMRYRDVDGVGVQTPFIGYFHRYEELDGMMIPVEGEVEWVLPEGRLKFWRGEVVSVTYGYR
jgi:hypothetical protein